MKPSNFLNFPFSSIFKNCECETIALNIMLILKRLGDEFKQLSWEEYKIERLKDKGFSNEEKKYFDKVVMFCSSADQARKFSRVWNF